eukprot:SAG25_NODE_1852_length_2253_cov_16.756267_2_plen_138_part_00
MSAADTSNDLGRQRGRVFDDLDAGAAAQPVDREDQATSNDGRQRRPRSVCQYGDQARQRAVRGVPAAVACREARRDAEATQPQQCLRCSSAQHAVFQSLAAARAAQSARGHSTQRYQVRGRAGVQSGLTVALRAVEG